MSDLRRIDWIIQKAELAESKLSAWERNFIDDMAHRRAKFGDRFTPSDRQMEVLETIAEKTS